MRWTRRDWMAVASVWVLPLALALAFPYRSVGFAAARSGRTAAPGVAFVRLSPEAEQQALRQARMAWQGQASDAGTFLPLGELPDEPPAPLVRLRCPDVVSAAPSLPAYGRPAWTTAASVPAPSAAKAEPWVTPPVFSREELLKLP